MIGSKISFRFFPEGRVISHAKTRAKIALAHGPFLAFNIPKVSKPNSKGMGKLVLEEDYERRESPILEIDPAESI